MATRVKKKRKVKVEDAKQTKKFFITTALIVFVILALMFFIYSRA